MKNTWKRLVSITMAVCLVFMCGVFSSDRFLQATDGQGDYVEDASGDAIAILNDVNDTEGEQSAQKIVSNTAASGDGEEPNYEVHVVLSSDSPDGDITEGTEITLTAVTSGFDGAYTLQWQCCYDGQNWEDIAGATGESYVFVMTDNAFDYSWRVIANAVEE